MHNTHLEIHKQTVPADTWVVKIPEGASKGRAIAAYGDNGDQVHWDTADFINGEVIVNFGVESITGELEYTYHKADSVDPDEPQVSYDDGKVVITINNNNNLGNPQHTQ